jgi:type 2 lantibiotic biosynthesis protein LanM
MGITPVQRERLQAIIARAATLAERASSPSFEPVPDQDPKAIESYRERWIQATSDGRRPHWEAILRARGIDPERSVAAVRLKEGAKWPEWGRTLLELLGADFSIEPVGERPDPSSYAPALVPFLAVAAKWLAAQAGKSPIRINEAARRGILNELRSRWTTCAKAAFHRELHVEAILARSRGDSTEITPRELARRRLATVADWVKLLELYPVLARLLPRIYQLWKESTLELLGRLARDRVLLGEKLFQGKEPSEVRAIELGRGDAHAGGRTVAILTFESEKVVYKPKDLRIAEWFLELSRKLSDMGLPAQLPARRILAREGYAWEEFVERAPCRDRAEVERFYTRVGELTRLLQLLDGSDVHSHNLIVQGEWPHVVDLETVLQHRPRIVPGTTELDRRSYTFVRDSPLAISLLPEWTLGDPGEPALAQGGLIRGGKHRTPSQLRSLKPPSARKGPVALEYVEFEEKATLPVLDGKPTTDRECAERVVAGYAALEACLRTHGAALAAPGGVLAAAGSCPVRFVARRTQVYANFLNDSLGAKALADGRDRELVLERLFLAARDGDDPVFPLVVEEVRALGELDVPLFAARPDGDAILVGDRAVSAKFFGARALDAVLERLARNDPAERARDQDVIRSAFATVHGPWPEVLWTRKKSTAKPSDDDLLGCAVEIGDEIARECVTSSGPAGWLALCEEPASGVTRLGMLPTNLFGSSGLAVTFAALHAASGQARFREWALRTFESVFNVTKNLPGYWRHRKPEKWEICGPFSGWSAHLYASSIAAALLQDETIRREPRTLLPHLPIDAVLMKAPWDLVSGASGLILALLSFNEPAARDAAIRIGEKLSTAAQARPVPAPPYPRRTRVLDRLPDTQPAVVLALLAVARAAGEARLAPPDVLARLEAGAAPTHGNLLARLAAAKIAGKTELGAELEGRVERALASSEFQPLDRLELALLAGRRFEEEARLAAGELVGARRAQGTWFPGGAFPDRHNLSVVGGLAGVALAFVRVARPGSLGAVQVLEGPG